MGYFGTEFNEKGVFENLLKKYQGDKECYNNLFTKYQEASKSGSLIKVRGKDAYIKKLE
jgi:hypothetical protein